MSLIQIDSEDKKTKDTPNPINLNIEKESEIKIWLIDPTYTQQFGEFIPYLSVLDLMFNCGDESKNIILQASSLEKK